MTCHSPKGKAGREAGPGREATKTQLPAGNFLQPGLVLCPSKQVSRSLVSTLLRGPAPRVGSWSPHRASRASNPYHHWTEGPEGTTEADWSVSFLAEAVGPEVETSCCWVQWAQPQPRSRRNLQQPLPLPPLTQEWAGQCQAAEAMSTNKPASPDR